MASEMASEMADDEATGTGYSIDELAVRTGVPSRTIRFYQSHGALPHPRRRGRTAVYDDSHVERLRLIAELQDRGLRLDAIRDLLSHERTEQLSVSDWLGLQDRLEQPWSDEQPRVLPEAEVLQMLGEQPPGTLAALVRAGLVERTGESLPASYLVRSVRLLEMGVQLLNAGLGLQPLVDAERTLRRRLGQAADEVVDVVTAEVERRLLEGVAEPDELIQAVDALRPVAAEATTIIFAQEIERAIRGVLERGGKPRPRRKSSRPRR